jgi:S-DNA-T family DNA segregation ATPase FtsK/SpoIIIE
LPISSTPMNEHSTAPTSPELPLSLGRTPDGQPVTFDLRRAPHILVSGTTGSGKSVALHSMICDLLAAKSPEQCSLVLIDPKRVEFLEYRGLASVVGPMSAEDARTTRGVTYTEPDDAMAALSWVLAAVETRFKLLAAHGVKDVSQVPRSALRASGQPGALVVVVDELADLMMAGNGLPKRSGSGRGARAVLTKPETVLARILQTGRAAGVHVILATQRPSHDVVTGVIKANVPTRLCFALQNATDSRVALGGIKGAETLSGNGDALWYPVGARIPIRMQGTMWAEDAKRDLLSRVPRVCSQEPSLEASSNGRIRNKNYRMWLRDMALI